MMTSMLGPARAAAAGITALGDALRPSIVEVRVREQGSGTGIIWGGGGLVVTNAHCVAGDGTQEVLHGGRWRDGRVIAYHASHDLALVAAPNVSGPLLETRRAESLQPGELVFAYGHPLGVRDSLAMGVIHAVNRDKRSREPRWIVADVRLAPGNSGGPLVDAEGRLLGINSMVVNGLALAVPADIVATFVARALERRVA